MDIYQPAEDSFLLQEQIRLHASGKVLDVGTGSGILALTASQNHQVESVLAIDINPQAIAFLKQKIKSIKATGAKELAPIFLKKSDLFSNVPRKKFDTIICNPPYLPHDPGLNDPAIYGGRKGFEWSESFLKQAPDYLASTGQILFLFSSLTSREKIDRILNTYLLDHQTLSTLKIAFETLYVYRITKSSLRKELDSHHISNLSYYDCGHRGLIYKALYHPLSARHKPHFPKSPSSKSPPTHPSFLTSPPITVTIKAQAPAQDFRTLSPITVAIKIKKPSSRAPASRLSIEAAVLSHINKYCLGPALLCSSPNFLCLEFIEGQSIESYLHSISSILQPGILESSARPSPPIQADPSPQPPHLGQTLHILHQIFLQCRLLDTLGYNKSEMHHPHKHILITRKHRPVFIDFERTSRTDCPKNVTGCLEYFRRHTLINSLLDINSRSHQLLSLVRTYKNTSSDENFNSLLYELFKSPNFHFPPFTSPSIPHPPISPHKSQNIITTTSPRP